ncbi:MAG: PKD domain-containing protein [Draconibacterium sp.]
MRVFFSILLSVLISTLIIAQDDICRKSTEGKDFWFGFMESRNYNPNHYLEITVTAREATTFTITVGPNEIPFNGTYTIGANSSRQVKILWDLAEATGSEEIQNKGIHLVAEKPVNVYALNWDQNSADVAVIYPVGSLGQEHFAMCYYPYIDINNPFTGNGRNSEFLIVATEDQTTVEITPTKVTDKLKEKDSTFSVSLNRGQVYQVQSENLVGSYQTGQGDLTGSYVYADKPIAFYSGSLSTTIPGGECCWDHLYEQIPAVRSWGREYFAVPLKSREKDRYRILAAEENTTIQITGEQNFKLNRGEFKEMVFGHGDPKRIFADKPILVAQFSQSRDVDAEYTGGDGDPFMIILSSTAQSKNDVTFVAYQSPDINIEGYTGIENYYVNIVCLTKEVPNIRLDGEAIQSEFKTFEGKIYSYAQIEINEGTHRIENLNDEGGFLAYVYGYGGVESYGYGVGFNLDLILDLGESINFNGDTLLLCNGSVLELDAGPYFDNYLWNDGSTGQSILTDLPGWYWVKAGTSEGCRLEDSVYVFKTNTKTDLGLESDDGCEPYFVALKGDDGYEKYLWQNEAGDTLSFQQIFIADKTGVFQVTVFDEYQCTATDKMSLVVHPVPQLQIEGDSIICGEKTTLLNVSISGTDENVWNFDGNYKWFSNKPDLYIGDQTRTTAKIEVSDWGDYEIYYQLTTIDGCPANDTLKIRFHPKPDANFSFEDDEKCKGYSRILRFTGAATDSADFVWDLDGCQFTDTLGWQHYNVSVGTFLNREPLIQLVINDNGCISNNFSKPIGAEPNFEMSADKRRGCDSLKVNFSSKLLTPDNVEFVWTLDDVEVIRQQDFTYYYRDTGFYKVNLTITNIGTQCKNGFTIDSMIKVLPTPMAKITADPNQCYPDTALIFYTNNIDSSFCYWEFDGLHQIGVGNDSIYVIIERPIGSVKLTVDEYGCVSEPFEMELKRKPHFDFYVDSEEGCQPYSVEVFAEPFDNLLKLFWLTDSLPYPTTPSQLYFFPDSGRFSISMAGYSEQTGCSDTLVKADWIWVHPRPFAKFEPDFPVALVDNARISFTNYSERANQYFWDFDDGQGTEEFEPVRTFTELGDYDTELISVSEFGCTDTFNYLIKVLPFSVYTPNAFRPDSEIQENRTFMPVSSGVKNDQFQLKIYDRWGQLIFETTTTYDPWNGKTKNGNDAPMGNYVWVADFYDIQGYKHHQKGQVLLIR